MLGQLFDLAYVEARKIWYFRWTVASIAMVLILLAAAAIYFMPNIYNAWGQVYVSKSTPLSVATEDISFAESKYGNPYLIQKTLLSDRNVERIITKLDPSFESLDKVQRELAVKSLRSSISITTDDQFIEFHVKGQDPVRARLIVKTIMDQFIADNMKLNRSELAQASTFLGQQIDAYRELLVESQSKLASFSKQHPQVVAVAAPRGDSGGRMVSVPASGEAAVENSEPAGPDTGALDGAIGDLERRVADLLTQYTEQYPDVVAARRKIATLKAQRAALLATAAVQASAAPSKPAATQAPAPAPRRFITVPAAPRSSAPPRVAPDLAAQWEALERENKLLADNYQKLVERREAAKMSLAVYESDSPGKFQVIREPAVPNIPIGPNRPLYMAIAAIAAVIAGLAAAYLRAAITGIFVSSRELEDAFHLPVVGTVSWEPAWHTGADKNKPLALPFLGKGRPRVTAVTRTIAL